MKILLNNDDLNEALSRFSDIGFVPTMGSLHKGHISLIKKSLKECSRTIVSIFVNPTQFDNKKDYKKYPRNFKKDLSILRKLKVSFVYLPKKKHIYNNSEIKVKLNSIDKILCAKYRKGHFEGVIDVMKRLIKIVKPSKIFMGEKDMQQLLLVKKYIKKSNNFKIIQCKTVRNKNKLALSSRNALLDKVNLNKAECIAKNLITFKKKMLTSKKFKELIYTKKKELKKTYNVNIEYLELRNKNNLRTTNKIKNSKLFIAYYLNQIRLIDNF